MWYAQGVWYSVWWKWEFGTLGGFNGCVVRWGVCGAGASLAKGESKGEDEGELKYKITKRRSAKANSNELVMKRRRRRAN